MQFTLRTKKLSNGNILYKTLDTYIDDVKISAYENYPNIDPMPYLVTDGKKMSVLGNVLNVYEPTDAGNLKMQQRCEYCGF
ncbi:MAG: hypothetical protein L6V93_03595 [Clostridiales bacterium]|nr:MAG: hypothetical protein L6V93_03595 [Clostridiales bacterium]